MKYYSGIVTGILISRFKITWDFYRLNEKEIFI